MAKSDRLTKYILRLQTEDFGKWIVEKRDEENSETPIQLPYVLYSEDVLGLKNDVSAFIRENSEMNFSDLNNTLKEYDLEWNMISMMKADVSALDARCILALLSATIRAERFSEEPC